MKVFVSSTYIDLKDHRKAVEEVINRLGLQYSGMEYFSSRPEEPKVAALQEIEKCDLFVGIYAYRYGTIPEGDANSVTEQEYDHAQELGLPCFCFRVDPQHKWPREFREEGEKQTKLQAFLKQIDERYLRDTFTTPDNLAVKVSTAISNWIAGKGISQDDYLNFVAERFQFIPTIDPNRQLAMDSFYITLQVGQEIRKEQKRFGEGNEERLDEKGIASSPLAWRDELRDDTDKTLKPIKVEDALRQRQVVILGDPGSGKTTLLHYLTYKFATREMPQKLLPIFVPLGQWAREKTNLLDFVVNNWGAKETDGIKQQRKHALSNWLKTGDCILLFDGLDEVGEAREDIIRRIAALSGDGQHSCPVVVTSRIVGYDHAFSGRIQHFEVMPLNDRQIQQYLDGYFTNEQAKSKNLWQALRSNPRMKALASAPFLLMVIAFVSDEKELRLPARRIDLYDQATAKLLKLRLLKWRGNERKLLEEAAYHFFSLPKGRHQHLFDHDDLLDAMEQGARQRNLTIASDRIEDILVEITQKGGLLTQLQEDVYAFLHLTFQEYLAACAIAERSDWLAIAKSTIWEDRWEEVLRLLVARISDDLPRGSEKLDQFFRTILHLEDDIFNTIICRLAKCASDCWGALPKDIQKEIRDQLFAIWLKKIKNDAWMDESALYALAAADKVLFDELVKALDNEDDDIRKQAAVAVGNTGHPDAVEALLKILENDEPGSIGHPDTVEALTKILVNDKYRYRSLRDQLVAGVIHPYERAIDPLITVFHGSKGDLRTNVALALASIGGRKVQEVLLSALKESDNIVQSHDLFGILLQTGIEDIVEDVSKALTYPNGQLKHWLSSDLSAIDYPKIEAAAGGMGREISASRPSDKIPEFQKILSSGSERERIDLLNNIVEIVGSGFNDFLGKVVISWGEKRKKEEQELDQEIKNDVKEAIGNLGADLEVQTLVGGLLTASSEMARTRIVMQLGEIGSEEAVEGIRFVLNDESKQVKFAAIQALGKVQSTQGIEVLGSLLQSEKDEHLKEAIINMLGKHRGEQAAAILIKTLLSDPENSTRQEAVKALGSIGDSEATPYLVQTLEEENDQIREYSAQSLGKIGGHLAIEALYQRLQTESNKWVKSYIWKGMRDACFKGETRLFPDGRILGLSTSDSSMVEDADSKEPVLRTSISVVSTDRLSATNASPEVDAGVLFDMATEGEDWISIAASHFWKKEWLEAIKKLVSLSPRGTLKLLTESLQHIPREWGQLVRGYGGEGDRLLILLQDNYFNWRARLNQAHILKALTYTGCVELVCSSGASGDVDTSSVSSFPDREIRLKVALIFLKSLELTAEEFCQIVDDTGYVIWGIEDAQLYKKQLGLVAEKRTTEMLKIHGDIPCVYLNNTLRKMEDMNVSVAVLSSGPFDLVSAAKGLEALHISYFWVKGKPEGADNVEEYNKLLLGKRRPIGDLIQELNKGGELPEF